MAAPFTSDTLTVLPSDPVEGAEPDRYLLVIDGSRSFIQPLPATGSVVVGRSQDAPLRIDQQGVSRHHAAFEVRDDGVRVVDLKSHNGTRVNGERIVEPQRLTSGDVVAIGDALVVLHAGHDREAPAPLLLEPAALRRQLVQELRRGLHYGRAVGLVLVRFEAAPERALVATRLRAALRPVDAAGWDGDTTLLVVLPERDGDYALAVAGTLLVALAELAPQARAGVASAPLDAVDAEALIVAARGAAAGANPGAAASAASAATRLTLSDRVVLLADPAMLRLYDLIRRLAQSTLPVLVSGETGTGKENAAFALHALSPRAAGRFVPINCAAIPETLVESELFGYEKGAFSNAASSKAGLLESADGGTIFFDEVGELPLAVQAKLLRALETQRVMRLGALRERPIDVRLVAATNRNLDTEVTAGRFRQDLRFRLGAAQVVLPPLRDRPREVGLLARSFMEQACARLGRTPLPLSAATLQRMAVHRWPGNVRELRNLMEFLAATVMDDLVEPWHLPEAMAPAAPLPASSPEEMASPAGDAPPVALLAARPWRPIAEEIRALEKRRMEQALEEAAGVQVRAAELIHMPLRTFVMKLKQYEIVVKRPRT